MKARNPDFVVLRPKQLLAYQAGKVLNSLRTSAVIEVFGDYWHGPTITGQERDVHQREVESYYALAGIVCLVLWESEVKQDPDHVAERIVVFLGDWDSGRFLGPPTNRTQL